MNIEYNRIDYKSLNQNETADRLYGILQRWVPFANEQFADWDGRPDCGHFFGGSYFYGVETAFPMFLYALLSKFGDYNQSITGIPREELINKVIKALRYLAFTNEYGPKDCVREKSTNVYANGTKWGAEGEEFFRATAIGRTGAFMALTAMMYRDRVDDEIFNIIEKIITAYADRWSNELPRTGTYFDTQSEENAWTAMGISGALVLYKKHPNREKWLEGFNRWALNSIVTYKDRMNTGTFEGKSLRNFWFKGVTFHPDMTCENHSFVHPSYVAAGMNLKFEAAIMLKMAGSEIPKSVFYNNEKVFEAALSKWCQDDGILIPIQGQDWWYTRYHGDHIMHSIMSVFYKNENSATYLKNSIVKMEQLQLSHSKHTLLEENPDQKIDEHGHYSLKDMEHSSVLNLLFSYLFHTYFGDAPADKPMEQINRELEGVYEYPFGCTIINRKKDSFSNFNWRNKVMAVNLPKDGMWTITPIIASMTGEIRFKNRTLPDSICNERDIRDSVKSNIYNKKDGFGATCTVLRDEKITQDISFVSLPDGVTVYTDRFTINKDCETTKFHGGLIGVRNENIKHFGDLAKGHVQIYTGKKEHTFKGWFGGENDDTVMLEKTGILNIDNKMGYVYLGSNGVKYINKHHYTAWKGVEDQLVFNNIEEGKFKAGQTIPTFTLIAAPNYTYEDTKNLMESVIICETASDDIMAYEINGYLITCNFTDDDATININGKTLELRAFESNYIKI